MTKKPRSLPRSGPLPRPTSPDEAREVLKAEAFPAPDVHTVTLSAVEFTSICPRTGQPDFGSVAIEYTPGERRLNHGHSGAVGQGTKGPARPELNKRILGSSRRGCQ